MAAIPMRKPCGERRVLRYVYTAKQCVMCVQGC